jgi:hypothetical protein
MATLFVPQKSAKIGKNRQKWQNCTFQALFAQTCKNKCSTKKAQAPVESFGASETALTHRRFAK